MQEQIQFQKDLGLAGGALGLYAVFGTAGVINHQLVHFSRSAPQIGFQVVLCDTVAERSRCVGAREFVPQAVLRS